MLATNNLGPECQCEGFSPGQPRLLQDPTILSFPESAGEHLVMWAGRSVCRSGVIRRMCAGDQGQWTRASQTDKVQADKTLQGWTHQKGWECMISLDYFSKVDMLETVKSWTTNSCSGSNHQLFSHHLLFLLVEDSCPTNSSSRTNHQLPFLLVEDSCPTNSKLLFLLVEGQLLLV